MKTDPKKEWEKYVISEKRRIMPLLISLDIKLDDEQPQTIGERYLTRPVDGGRKVVFFGRFNNDTRVVIKTSNEQRGVDELTHEKHVHTILTDIRFAYNVFFLPKIIHFDKSNGVLITEYIKQEMSFLERDIHEQFSIALKAFKVQESAHAITAEHLSAIKNAKAGDAYFIKSVEYKKIRIYATDILKMIPVKEVLYSKLSDNLSRSIELVNNNSISLDRYNGFLTHWDFTPQNFRIRNGKLYLLDLTSMRFGNKYEGWARFINFMTLYNPSLANALVDYVRLNRTEEEVLVLTTMRTYRLVELLRYYAEWLDKTSGDTYKLAKARIELWSEVLDGVLNNKEIPSETIEHYKHTRDLLRSVDEKKRQQGLH